MITPQKYKKSQNVLKQITKSERKQIDIFESEKTKIENKYYTIIRSFKDKEYEELGRLRKQKEKFEGEIAKLKKPHHNNYEQFKRIIKFMGLKKKDVDLNIEVYNYDYPRDDKGEVIRDKNNCYPEKEKIIKKPLVILRDNEFYKTEVYIYKNRKPKNKFTLCLIGRSIFNSGDILDFGGGYLSVNENGHFRKVLKELPDRKDLIKWFEKNKEKITNYKSDEFKEAIKEYKEVLKKTNSNKWEIAYLENRKDYYENHYSRGTETKEYIEAIRGLIKITKGKKKEECLKIIKQAIVNNLEQI